MSTSSTSSLYSSSNRITALYSELDTDALVKSACSTQQSRVDKQIQAETVLQYKDESLASIRESVQTFTNTYCKQTGSSSLLTSSAYYAYSVSNLTDSSSSAVTISASGSTTYTGNVSVLVSQLAKNSSVTSSSGLTSAKLVGAANTVSTAGYNASTTLGNYAFSTDMQFDTDGKISFSITNSSGASQTFSFSKDDTIQTVLDTINTAGSSGLGVTMSYDSTTDGFKFAADNATDTLTFTNITGNAFGDKTSTDSSSVFDIYAGTAFTGSACGTLVSNSVADTALSKLTNSSGTSLLTFDTDGNTSMTVNGTTFTFSQTDTISDIITEVNASTAAGVTMAFDSSTGSFTVTADTAGTSGAVAFSGDLATAFGLTTAAGATVTAGTAASGVSKSGTGITDTYTALSELSFSNTLKFNSSGKIGFSINGVDFSFSKDTTLQSMLNTINNSDAGVTMVYSRLTDKFTITADEGGADSKVVIENTYGNAFGSNSAFGIEEGTYSNGNNALATITINGESTVVEEDSNSFKYDGISYTLKSTTVGTENETLTFNISRDYSATVASVQTFVDAYNALLTTLTDAVEFDTDTDYDPDDYPPLTDAQKEEMSDDEIEKWEAKSKDHLLRGDSEIESLISSLKNVFYSALGGTGMNGTDIGITTAGYYESNAGQLVLDSTKLTEALEENGSDVVSMFTNTTTGERGAIYQISDLLNAYDDTAEDTISSNVEKITAIKKTVSSLEDKLEDMADKYYSKYAAMETALSSLNSQASALSSLLGTG